MLRQARLERRRTFLQQRCRCRILEAGEYVDRVNVLIGEDGRAASVNVEVWAAPVLAYGETDAIYQRSLVGFRWATGAAEVDIQEQPGQELAGEREIGQDLLVIRAADDLILARIRVCIVADLNVWRIGIRGDREEQPGDGGGVDEIPDC